MVSIWRFLQTATNSFALFTLLLATLATTPGARRSVPSLPTAYPASSPLVSEDRVSHWVTSWCNSGGRASATMPSSSFLTKVASWLIESTTCLEV